MGGDRSRWLYVISAAMVLTLAALTYFLFGAHAPLAREDSPPPARASAKPAVPQWLPMLVPSIAADQIDVCGYGPVNLGAVEQIHAKARAAADSTFSRLKAKLMASRDARENALGLYLQQSTETQDSTETTDTLSRLALFSRDPQVYGLAFLACRQRYGLGCDSLLMQWAAVEPENAAPWLLLAGSWNHYITREEAIYRASEAKRFETYFPNLLGLIQLPEIQDQPPQTRSVLEEDLLAMQITLPTLDYRQLFQYCNYPSVADASRIGVCSNVSKLFIEQDRTMIGFALGIKLAQTAGWSSNVVDELRKRKVEEEAAQRAALTRQTQASSDCEEQAAFERWATHERLGDRRIAMESIEGVTSTAGGTKLH